MKNDKGGVLPNTGANILLAVTGMSPQIVTETLYALAVARTTPWLPNEIHLISTARGAAQARLNLLSDSPGWFHRLCRDYALPPIRFSADHIHVLADAQGQPLEDIRTPQDNEAAADFITERVRELSRDPASTLHASIAGGRKTMGFYLGYAMSLYGRPQDRLSHVLVSAPFEGHPDFYYPTPEEQVIQAAREGRRLTLDARDAEVSLADIPFVRLREGLPRRLLEGQARFSQSVQAAQQALQPAELEINLAKGSIRAGGAVFSMPPADLAFYAMLARRARAGHSPLRWTDDSLPGLYLAEYARLVGRHSGPMQHAEQRLADAQRKTWFEERMSKLKRLLLNQLDAAARPYLIHAYGQRPQTRYGLALAPAAIHIDGEDTP